MVSELAPVNFSAWQKTLPAAEAPAVVLDVREPWEVQTASIKPDGFTLLCIPMGQLPARLAQLKETLPADQPIACLCHHGVRSLQVANYLAQNGFTEVVNLQGGISAWSLQCDFSVPQY